jgi:hypothetical protein
MKASAPRPIQARGASMRASGSELIAVRTAAAGPLTTSALLGKEVVLYRIRGRLLSGPRRRT